MSDLYSMSARFTADDTDFQAKISSVVKGLDNFGASFEQMTNETKRSFAELGNQFVAIDQKAKLWGNSSDVVAQKQKVLKDQINKLVDDGMKIESKQIQDLKKAFDELGKKTEDVGRKSKLSFADMRDIMQGPVAAGKMIFDSLKKVAAVVGELTEAYKVQEKAETQLEAAALNNPLLTSSSVSALKDYASALQSVSTTGDEELLPFMAQLASAGRTQDEIMKIMKTALDIAASGAMSLDGAVRNLNKTYGGFAGELAESMPDVKSLTAEELKQGKAVDLLASKYAGMSEQVARNTGTAEQLANSFGDLKEELGAPFEKNISKVREYFIEFTSGWANAARERRLYEEGKTEIEGGTADAGVFRDVIAGEETILASLKAQLVATNALNKSGAAGRAHLKQSQVSDQVKAVEAQIKAKEEYIATLKKEQEAKDAEEKATADAAAADAALVARNKAAAAWIEQVAAERMKAVEKIDLQAKAENKLATEDGKLAVEQEKLNAFLTSYVRLVGDSGGLVSENNQAAQQLLVSIQAMTKNYADNVEAIKGAAQAAKERAALEKALTEKQEANFRKAKTREKETVLSAAKAQGRSAQELTDIALKFDKQMLESFQRTKNEELGAAIEAAQKIGASEETLATITKMYQQEITEFAQDQARERLAIVKELTDDVEDEEEGLASSVLSIMEGAAAVLSATISAASNKLSKFNEKKIEELDAQIEALNEAIEGATDSIAGAYEELSDIAEREFAASTKAINRSFDEQKESAEETYDAMIKAAIESGDIHKATVLEGEKASTLAEIERRRQVELTAAEVIKRSKQAEFERTTAAANASTEIEKRVIQEMEAARLAYEEKLATVTGAYETEYTSAKESYDAQIAAALAAGEYQRAEALQTERETKLSEIERRKNTKLEELEKTRLVEEAELQKRKIAEETTAIIAAENEKQRLETDKTAAEAAEASQKAAAELGQQFIGMALDVTKFITSGFTDVGSLISAISTAMQIAFDGDTEKAERFMEALEKVVNLVSMILVPVFQAMAEVLLMIFEALGLVNDGFVEIGKFLDWLDELTGQPIYFDDIADSLDKFGAAVGESGVKFGEFISAFTDFGGNVIQGIIDGILGAGERFWDSVSSVFTGFVDGVKDFFGIHSPSTLFKDFGGNIIQGMIDGILGIGAGMWDAVKGVFEGLWGHIQNVFKGAMDFGKSIGKTIVDGANTLVKAGKDFVEDPAGATGKFVEKTAEKAGSLAKTVGGVATLGYDMANQALKSTDAGRFVANTTENVGKAVSNAATGLVSAVTSIELPKIELPKIELPKIKLPKFKGFATGTEFAPGGLSIVGEQGAEFMNVPRGTQIVPAQRTEQLLSKAGKSIVFAPVFNSPKAMNQIEQMRALKDYERELAFTGVF